MWGDGHRVSVFGVCGGESAGFGEVGGGGGAGGVVGQVSEVYGGDGGEWVALGDIAVLRSGGFIKVEWDV